MRNQASISKVERWLLPMTSSLMFLLIFFCSAILAVAMSFWSRKGADMLAFPLFAWSPFLLLLGMEQLARGIRKIRALGAWRMAVNWAGICSVLVAISCFVFARYLHSATSFYLLILGIQQLGRGLRKIWGFDEQTTVPLRDGSWLVCGAIGLFTFACYLHSTAPITRL